MLPPQQIKELISTVYQEIDKQLTQIAAASKSEAVVKVKLSRPQEHSLIPSDCYMLNLTDIEKIQQIVENNKTKLIEIDFHYVTFTIPDLTILIDFLKANKIKAFRVSGCNLGQAGIDICSQLLAPPYGLRSFCIENEPITNMASIYRELIKDPQNSQLQELRFNRTRIDDTDAIMLTEALLNHPSLKVLWLNNNWIGDEGIKVVSSILENKNLTELYIAGQDEPYSVELKDFGKSSDKVSTKERCFSDETMKIICPRLETTLITNLHLPRCSFNGIKILFESLEKNISLKSLLYSSLTNKIEKQLEKPTISTKEKKRLEKEIADHRALCKKIACLLKEDQSLRQKKSDFAQMKSVQDFESYFDKICLFLELPDSKEERTLLISLSKDKLSQFYGEKCHFYWLHLLCNKVKSSLDQLRNNQGLVNYFISELSNIEIEKDDIFTIQDRESLIALLKNPMENSNFTVSRKRKRPWHDDDMMMNDDTVLEEPVYQDPIVLLNRLATCIEQEINKKPMENPPQKDLVKATASLSLSSNSSFPLFAGESPKIPQKIVLQNAIARRMGGDNTPPEVDLNQDGLYIKFKKQQEEAVRNMLQDIMFNYFDTLSCQYLDDQNFPTILICHSGGLIREFLLKEYNVDVDPLYEEAGLNLVPLQPH